MITYLRQIQYFKVEWCAGGFDDVLDAVHEIWPDTIARNHGHRVPDEFSS